MLLHTEYAEVSDVGANALLPVKLRPKPALRLFTRRFEAQLHWQPVAKVWLHSTGDASPPAALLLAQILPVFSVVAPCRRGASPVSVRRQTFTTGC